MHAAHATTAQPLPEMPLPLTYSDEQLANVNLKELKPGKVRIESVVVIPAPPALEQPSTSSEVRPKVPKLTIPKMYLSTAANKKIKIFQCRWCPQKFTDNSNKSHHEGRFHKQERDIEREKMKEAKKMKEEAKKRKREVSLTKKKCFFIHNKLII